MQFSKKNIMPKVFFQLFFNGQATRPLVYKICSNSQQNSNTAYTYCCISDTFKKYVLKIKQIQ